MDLNRTFKIVGDRMVVCGLKFVQAGISELYKIISQDTGL